MVEYPSSLLDAGLSLPHSAVRMARTPGATGGLTQALPVASPEAVEAAAVEAAVEMPAAEASAGVEAGWMLPAAAAAADDFPSRTWTRARTDGVQGSLHQLLRFSASAGVWSNCDADWLCGSNDSVRGRVGIPVPVHSATLAHSFRFSCVPVNELITS